MAKRQIRVGKIDLDTVGAAWLLGVDREDEVIVLRSEASEEDLANPEILCIEVGGSGRVSEGNFDHHQEGGPIRSATCQVYSLAKDETRAEPAGDLGEIQTPVGPLGGRLFLLESLNFSKGIRLVKDLVDYIDILDTKGPQVLPGYGKAEGFPYLSDVFAGMLLTERDPVEQLHKGVEILCAVVEYGQDPYGTIKGFDSYAEAKVENTRQIAKALEQARWETTQGGLKLGYLETQFFGAPGALYGNGAQVVVALNPNMNGVRKFTIAGNGIRVDAVAPKLNQLEAGWGGPATGTILGSPREGSKLTLEEVVRIVKENL